MSLFEAQARAQFASERIQERRQQVEQLQSLKDRDKGADEQRVPLQLVKRPLMLLMRVIQR